jgi:hypothetical protein
MGSEMMRVSLGRIPCDCFVDAVRHSTVALRVVMPNAVDKPAGLPWLLLLQR